MSRGRANDLGRFLFEQVRASRRELSLVVLCTALVLVAVLFLHAVDDAPLDRLVRDPAGLTGSPFHLGFLSNLGILLWAAAAAVSLFAAMILYADHQRSGWARFGLATSGLSILAALDDTYLLHEQVLPKAGIDEKLTLAAYALAAAAYLFVFRFQLLKTKLALLGLAFLFIAASTALDLRDPLSTGRDVLIEEGAKFGGIVAWLTFVWTASLLAMTSRDSASSAR